MNAGGSDREDPGRKIEIHTLAAGVRISIFLPGYSAGVLRATTAVETGGTHSSGSYRPYRDY